MAATLKTDVYVDGTAVIDPGASLEEGVRVWHFAHVRTGAHIAAHSSIGKCVYVDAGVRIGARCKIQNFVSVYSGVTLEDDVFVGPAVTFTNDRFPRASGDWEIEPTLVRHGASIGANSTILCGTTIGKWAVVAAGAVVIRDVPPHRVVAGNPARPIAWACRCGRTVEAPGESCTACGEVLSL
jgi:acetyltransferase-like isoleucine patch superfamily enzyme